MVRFRPSWNTDQGVQHVHKFLGGKTLKRREIELSEIGIHTMHHWQHMIFCE